MTRHVGLPGQNHEIGHQLEVVREDLRDADGALDKEVLLALLLGQLYAPLDIADSLEILVDLVPIRSADLQTQASDFSVDRIEDAAIFSIRQPRLRIGPASPNRRSKTARGRFSIGSGVVSLRHEIVL